MSLRRYISARPTAVFKFRYENPDFLRENGKPHFRVITVPVGFGRFKPGREADALEIAERRLNEAYGQAALDREERIRLGTPVHDAEGTLIEYQGGIPGHIDPAADKIRHIPGLHQDGYKLVSAERVK